MRAHEFFEAVRRRADLESDDRAARVTRATLSTLGERLTRGEAADIAAALPEDLASALLQHADESPPGFGVEEFLDRVRDRSGEPSGDAERNVESVMATLAEAVPVSELRAAREQLPQEYAALFDVPEADERDEERA